MKKILMGILMVLGFSGAVFAGVYNIPQGKYICLMEAKADDNWNIIYKLSEEQMKQTIFTFNMNSNSIYDPIEKKTYKYIGSTKDASDMFFNGSVGGFVIPKNAKVSKDMYKMGLILIDKKKSTRENKVFNKVIVDCQKQDNQQ